MKNLKKVIVAVVTLLSVSMFSSCDLYTYSTGSVQSRYDNPAWAPPYSEGVRYYYLPDIEAYYDLSARQFVYLSNGRWYDSSQCPSIYAGFDLNNCFAIALDVNVYQPWMHHQYYVSHYPRYYYRDYYDHSNIPYVRGFNENTRSAIYWSQSERSRARNWDDEGLKSDRQFKYTKEDRKQQYNWNNSGQYKNSSKNDNRNNQSQGNWNDNNNSQRQDNRNKNNNGNNTYSSGNDGGNRSVQNHENNNVAPTRTSGVNENNRQQPDTKSQTSGGARSTNYYGRTIGQPVKVERQMRQQTRPSATGSQENRNGGARTEQNNQDRR